MKVGYISNVDIKDRRGWSGTVSHLADTISLHHEVIPIVVENNKIGELSS